jgi:hypothetical protein
MRNMNRGQLAQELRTTYDGVLDEVPSERWNRIADKVIELINSGVIVESRKPEPRLAKVAPYRSLPSSVRRAKR